MLITAKITYRCASQQGYYLAFIHTYAYMFGRPPAEADIQRHVRVSPPSVHPGCMTQAQKLSWVLWPNHRAKMGLFR